MNKTAIKNFAIWARNKLIADIKYKAGLMGITEKGTADALPQSTRGTEFYDIGTSEPYTISGKEIEQRRRLKEVIENKASDTDYATAYKYVIEEVAYTWFNRLIAVRFMEVNDYLPGHIRVLSSETGKMEPDLVTTPFDAELEFTSTEEEQIIQLKQDNKIDELFRMLFIKQCNALNELLPALFEKTNDYTEILLNLSVIDQEGVVYRLVHDIPEEDFDVNRGGQVEIIGWLYQYYNTEPKNDAFAKKRRITKEEIPAVTQLFTPDWIVRYMVENSLGRLWLEGHPDDTLKANWKYYLDEAEQEPEVQCQLDKIKKEHAKLNPEDIKLIDPCMGSGHILVYAFDVFMQIYESVGWNQRDAAKSILENNIYGLDIDDRAFQMAYFAVMMKARQYNRRILTPAIQCHVYSVQESNGITNHALQNMGGDLSKEERNEAIKEIRQLLALFKNAKEYGSIIDVPKLDWELIKRFIKLNQNAGQITLDFYGERRAAQRLLKLVEIAKCIHDKYSVVLTNPPYMTVSNMSANVVEQIENDYPEFKHDLCCVFIERCRKFASKDSLIAMITQQAFMSNSRYENAREKIINQFSVNSLLHLGAGAFEEISGEVVQTCTFTFRNQAIAGKQGIFIDLQSGNYLEKQECIENFVKGNRDSINRKYLASLDQFSKIDGVNFSYWISLKTAKILSANKQVSFIAEPRHGLVCGNGDIFIRFWTEVNASDIHLENSDDQKVYTEKKWFPYNKGGAVRRWYGNREYVVNWKNNGFSIRNYTDEKGKIKSSNYNLEYNLRENISWSDIKSGKFAARLTPKGSLFDTSGPSLFLKNNSYKLYLLGLMNSCVMQKFINIYCTGLHYSSGAVGKVPLIISEADRDKIGQLVNQCIDISQSDWNYRETSWMMKSHPLSEGRTMGRLISEKYKGWQAECEARFNVLKTNEEELNRIFIDIYGLQDELTPEVEEKDVTVRKADLQRDIKSLFSYAVGCMFGRYSLDYEGLAYAGGTFDDRKYSTFIPDVDGIIPITDEEYLEDDIVGLFCAWLKKVYGEETLEENLDFIAKALGKKGNSSREIIRNYFLTDFYKDHCSTYSVTGSGKRPIYWLFDSGKLNGFKALIYLHRYTPDTIGNLRVDYLHRMQRVYESEMNRMQDMIEHSTNSREVAAASKRKEKLQKQLKECREYDEKISHLALDRIELDLDDGVKYNYRKIQTGSDGKFYEVLADSKSIMMDAKKYADFKK